MCSGKVTIFVSVFALQFEFAAQVCSKSDFGMSIRYVRHMSGWHRLLATIKRTWLLIKAKQCAQARRPTIFPAVVNSRVATDDDQ